MIVRSDALDLSWLFLCTMLKTKLLDSLRDYSFRISKGEVISYKEIADESKFELPLEMKLSILHDEFLERNEDFILDDGEIYFLTEKAIIQAIMGARNDYSVIMSEMFMIVRYEVYENLSYYDTIDKNLK